jgi:phosphoribosylformylglycinamidine cyclo-ligase
MKDTHAGGGASAGGAYKAAGVDIDLTDRLTEVIAGLAGSTHRPEVLSGVGLFGGFFEMKGYRQPVLVSSTDSVGTKLKIACALGKHDTIGIDIVNHCVNDILTGGAEPLFFLDYVAMGKLVAEKMEAIVQGLAQACREVGCALIGGETAVLPGIYQGEDYDLVGFVVGAVEKDAIIRGEKVAEGDAIIGLPSSGLHTNGYSLVRRVLGETRRELDVHYPELGRTIGEELLEPHRCYYNQLKPLLPVIKGMAHITQGGLPGNTPRILPQGLMARFDAGAWTVPPTFRLIQEKGGVDPAEMFRVFNMGIGMVVICSPEDAGRFTGAAMGAIEIGSVVKQDGDARTVIQ